MKYRDEILQTLFGGGILDYDMLEKCEYDFGDVLYYIKEFTTIEDMTFNDILLGAIKMYKDNLQEKIDEKRKELEDNLKYLKNKLDYVAYGKRELAELEIVEDELDKIYRLDAFTDIEYYLNYLETKIFIVDDEIRAIYKELLADEIDEENEKIGFVELDYRD